MLFIIQNFTQGDLHFTGGIQISFLEEFRYLSLQWNYKPLERYLNPSSGIINPLDRYLNPSGGIINP